MKNNKKIAQSLIEYGLILALVAVVAIAALQFLGKQVNSAATKAGDSVVTQTETAASAYCDSIATAENGCKWDGKTCVCKGTVGSGSTNK